MKKFLFNEIAKIKPRELRMRNTRIAWNFFSSPEAKGLFDFSGWSLSSSRSLRSFKIYREPERMQKAIKAIIVFKRRGRLKIF